MLTTADRLKEVRTKQNLTQEDFATILGTTRGTYKNYERGQSEPSPQLLLKIAKRYDIDLYWLLGEHNTSMDRVGDKSTNHREKEDTTTIRHIKNITVFGGDIVHIDKQLSEVEEWIAPKLGITQSSNKVMYSFDMQGDSMLPTISPNDLLICEPPINNLQELAEDGIYVIINHEGARCKRVRRATDCLILYSDNQTYRDTKINDNGVSLLRVVHRITTIREYR